MIKKTLCIFLIAALLAMTSAAIAAEPVAENSGAITATKTAVVGAGGLIGVFCRGNGATACACDLYDSGTAASGTQLPGVYTTAASGNLSPSWTSSTPVRFANGITVSPAAGSKCFVSWLRGGR
jgi:hypothetical protein